MVVNLRFLIGFGFLPAGLKKVLGQPFTDPGNTGAFHDFLHAFHATGGFYRFVGAVQLVAAVLLLTQRFATAGAALATPVLATIMVFCWSTAVYPTAAVVTLMFFGALVLLLWDLPRWRGLVHPPAAPATASIDRGLWQACGAAIVALYLASCALSGGVYRPRGADLSSPGFYIFPVIALLPVVTLLVDRARHRRAQRL